jgi:hypothetical protein
MGFFKDLKQLQDTAQTTPPEHRGSWVAFAP